MNFELPEGSVNFGEARLSLKFGPSAWKAIADDRNWHYEGAEAADYSKLFVAWADRRLIRQVPVDIANVLDGDAEDAERILQSISDIVSREPASEATEKAAPGLV